MSGDKVIRLLYKEISGGDIKKFAAESNKDGEAGGGARDLRFGGFDELKEFLGKMFSGRNKVNRKRNGKTEQLEQLSATFHWLDGEGNPQTKTAYVEPPTTARPNEWRLTRVDTFSCFREEGLHEIPGDRLFLLIVQMEDGAVWPYLRRESELLVPQGQPGAWHPDIANPIISCANAKRPKNVIVMGFNDYTQLKGYCNGK
ncbi:hypothetical protein [Lysobacter sp. H23M47]|uniref:hypothetical protein n=1 Tax=Lysobacter sp. H23M47 TaxID=2781024 RepID=UPI00187EC3D2|nr:hypothetical protein [Lysobacter sp. H23M47]QOW23596.1 hypothetical protein INQ43_07350 [Lysobacter sp. H23M47]